MQDVINTSMDCLIYRSNFTKTFQKRNCYMSTKYLYTPLKIENVIARKKVYIYIVLDDIDSVYQLDALLGNKCLHPGSKIIVTTKNASLTERCAIFNPQVISKHTKCKDPIKEGYKDVSKKIVKYCEGHLLALEVFGRSLHNRDVEYWEECIQGLNKEIDSRIKKALQLSFNSLPTENDKELFKHIACFFVGKDKDLTEIILNACDIKTRTGITNLIDRCLLSIGRNNELLMHQLVQEMGRDLIRLESPSKPWKWSRLWCHEEPFKVLKQEKILDLSFCEQLHILGGFLELPALERLIVRYCICLIEVCESFEQCVEVVLIDLSYCYKLKRVPIAIGKLNKVKTLLLDGCDSREYQAETCDMSSSVVSVNSKTSLRAIMEALPSHLKFFEISPPITLRTLSLANNKLCNESFPMDLSCLSMLEELGLDNNPIVSMPNCVGTLPRLEKLSMNNCDKLHYEFGFFSSFYEGKVMLNSIKEEEYGFGYYKPQNHITSVDLSSSQFTMGEYIIDNMTFMRIINKTYSHNHCETKRSLQVYSGLQERNELMHEEKRRKLKNCVSKS
ncbi:disease resistance protein Roq1-like [Bidens hawaiensis]|uniref:disease resistance protein Roq1-like n=1 Tax=Bidens hawaiensis TaxID=980011 RepID=UPI00404940C2